MPVILHEVSGGGFYKPTATAANYRLYLTIDGQKKFKKTTPPTSDPDEAQSQLDEWKAEARHGVQNDTRLKYEGIRDEYMKAKGDTVDGATLKNLDRFFAGLRIAAITVDKLEEFREWRENTEEVLEYKQQKIDQRITYLTMQALNGHRKSITAAETTKIKTDATQWVENGVKATTDRRFKTLRAMFRFSMKRGKIQKNDVPHFPIVGEKVDNKKRGFFEESQFNQVLGKLPKQFHPFVHFMYATGMRSGQAAQLTWGMVNEDRTQLRIPGEIIKNKEDFTLPLVYANGKTIKHFEFRDNERRDGEPIFDTIGFEKAWRQACHDLKLGIISETTSEAGHTYQTYVGMSPHDFRRTACRNMISAGIPETVAMAISGHRTNYIFKRYAIVDQTLVQSAFEKIRRNK